MFKTIPDIKIKHKRFLQEFEKLEYVEYIRLLKYRGLTSR